MSRLICKTVRFDDRGGVKMQGTCRGRLTLAVFVRKLPLQAYLVDVEQRDQVEVSAPCRCSSKDGLLRSTRAC